MRGLGSEELAKGHAVNAASSDDAVVHQSDLERGRELPQPLGRVAIQRAGHCHTGRVIVRHDQAKGPQIQCPMEKVAQPHRETVTRPLRHPLVPDEAVAAIQVDGVEPLLSPVIQFTDQVIPESWVRRADPLADQLLTSADADEFATGDYGIGHGRIVLQRLPQCVLGGIDDTGHRAEAGDKGFGKDL